MLKCKGGESCVSRREVCDGVINCPRYREDEKYCSHDIQGTRARTPTPLCINMHNDTLYISDL